MSASTMGSWSVPDWLAPALARACGARQRFDVV